MEAFRALGGFVLLCTVAILTQPLAVQARDLYRYTNDSGITVLNDRISIEDAARGYEVLNEEGVVLKVVPRELTPEELAQRDVTEQRAAEAAEESDRLRKWDESLLLRYSTIEDIEAARDRALQDLRIRVSILKNNTRSLKLQVENYQSTAADIERRGLTVGAARLAHIEQLQVEIATTERSVVDREAEITRVMERFQLDIGRFELLQELAELRRTLLAKEQ